VTAPPTAWRKFTTLTVPEAAAVLGISRSLAFEMARDGRLPTLKDPSHRLRVRTTDLVAMLRADDDQPDLFAGTVTYTDAWLQGVLADDALDDDARTVARFLAAHADENGEIDADVADLLNALGGDEA
jgi:excisionase family DNA binding protein